VRLDKLSTTQSARHDRGGAGVTAVIETRQIGKAYGTTVALADLTMQVMRGEIFGFLGPNGAGKTTAVKVLLGLVLPTQGAAAILGKPLGDIPTRRQIGYLPELFRYQEWLTARELLNAHASLMEVPQLERRPQIDAILERIGLSDRHRDRVGTFSKGMQQRLGLGIALIGQPEVIFLDEPTSALDPVGRADVRALLLELRAKGTTVFLNSHMLSEVESVCDRVAVIDKGSVVASGTLETLLGRFALRVRMEEITHAIRGFAERYDAAIEEDAVLFYGLDEARVPDLIAQLVAAGARITSVEPIRRTLEQRFLELLQKPDEDTTDRIPRFT